MLRMFQVLMLTGITATFVLATSPSQEHSVVPKDGFVPNEQTAVAIAEAVLRPIYGEEHIARQRPFRASLSQDVWSVEGTLPKGMLGGTAKVRLSKADGRVLQVTHSR
jgi:hypothetical protein